jgi:hypothetical protein
VTYVGPRGRIVPPTLERLQAHLIRRVHELRPICAERTPWVFLCAAAFIEFLARLAYGDRGRTSYVRFISEYFPMSYSKFQYQSGAQDLPEQLYRVLRCGLLHAMSLVPDDETKKLGGRDRSVVLTHREKPQWVVAELSQGYADIEHGLPPSMHLTGHSSSYAPDAVVLVAEDFLEDLERSVEELVRRAHSDDSFSTLLCERVAAQPPLSVRFDAGEI